MSYRKPLIAAALALAGALAAGAANAGSDVHWSIGVNLPVYPNVSVGVSSAPPVYGPRYGYHAPVVVAPPVVYVPQPVYRRPVPVYCRAGLRAEPPVWKMEEARPLGPSRRPPPRPLGPARRSAPRQARSRDHDHDRHGR